MDYKELLKKYMTHIVEIEGVSFLDLSNNDFSFTKEELEILEEIEKEIFE